MGKETGTDCSIKPASRMVKVIEFLQEISGSWHGKGQKVTELVLVLEAP